MPTRLLYEKITVSVTLAELTAEEERFFYRLLVKCDDHGRFHAHPAILLGHLFSLQSSEITADDVLKWRQRLEDVGLIRTYLAEGREYLTVSAWKAYQRQRASSSKYPEPPFGEQSRADVREERQEPLARRLDTLPGDDTRWPVPGDDGRDSREDGADAPAKPTTGRKIPRKSSAATEPPEFLEPTDTEYRLGEAVGLSRGQVNLAAAAMLDHWRAKGERRSDWLASLRTWLRNAQKYDRQPAASPRPNGAVTSGAPLSHKVY